MGSTTSPQKQNPQAGADQDPCEVLLSMLYPRLFNIKEHVLHEAFIRHTSVYHSCLLSYQNLCILAGRKSTRLSSNYFP